MKIRAKAGGGDIPPATAGRHHAVLAEIFEEEPEMKFGKIQHQGIFLWQIEETVNVDFDGPEVRRLEIRGYFDSANGLGSAKTKKGPKLRQWLEGWRGKPFTEEDLMGFVPVQDGGGGQELDLDKLIGKSCDVVVVPDVSKGGRPYAKLQAVLPAGTDKIVLTSEFLYTPLGERKRNEEQDTPPAAVVVSAEIIEDDEQLPWFD
jgi:hypothetical protein